MAGTSTSAGCSLLNTKTVANEEKMDDIDIYII